MTKTRVAWILIALLTLAALGLRIRGISHGLPVALEQDCKIPRQVELLRDGTDAWRTDREFRWYPLFVAHVIKSSSALPPAPLPSDATLDMALQAAAAPHIQARLTVVLLAVLAIPLTFVLASWFLERRWALVAAAFVALSLLHHNFSQQSRPHAVACATFLAAVVTAIRVRHQGTTPNYALAGAACAIALGTLHTGVLTLAALFTGHFARRTYKSKVREPRFYLALALIALSLPVFYPFLFFAPPAESVEAARNLGFDARTWTLFLGGHEIFLKQFVGAGVEPTFAALFSYEPVLLALLALAGILLVARLARRAESTQKVDNFTRRRDMAVVLSFVLPYALLILLYERTYERFLLPLLPYIAIAAAFALRELSRGLARRAPAFGETSGQVGLCAAALALPAWGSWRLSEIRAAPHTTTVAAQWLASSAQPEQRIALWPGLDLPLARDLAKLGPWPGPKVAPEARFQWPWSRFQALHPEWNAVERWTLTWMPAKLLQMRESPEAFVLEQSGELTVIEVFSQNRTDPAGTRVREALAAQAELLVRIGPDGPGTESLHPLGYQDETSVPAPHFLLRVLNARRTGPVIEVYGPARR
jgi:4-amino-4-deoxy-L-arabinose transferase-like glycosyltransferase